MSSIHDRDRKNSTNSYGTEPFTMSRGILRRYRLSQAFCKGGAISRSSSGQGTSPAKTRQRKTGITSRVKFSAPSGRSLSCRFLRCGFTSVSTLTLVSADTSFSTLTLVSACDTSFSTLTLRSNYNRTRVSQLLVIFIGGKMRTLPTWRDSLPFIGLDIATCFSNVSSSSSIPPIARSGSESSTMPILVLGFLGSLVVLSFCVFGRAAL